ncbi:putative protein ASPARTIC PROTEASE IN GUARD CELL 2 isoform X2 [Iris pallida]|uniref:Peptidase A1 domain-containing protein n=1 Tax=Iris pallida TaxID=29817 RepID=A0AAX6I8S7_IRIPA|nr:putative protein ASPARTIC PROTEASE IN GUARD CELL 2 isoform X2 [Iris pallida]
MANILSSLPNAYAFLLLLFSVLLICRPSSFVCGLDNAVATHHVVSVNSIFPEQTCSDSKELGSSSLKVVHRHGPCSPMKHKKKLSHEEILEQDQIRVDWVRSKVSKTSQPESVHHSSAAASKIPATSGRAFSTGNFIVTVGFGTPKLQQSVIFDTGSDVTWIQCQPCVSVCYQQQQQLFDPSKSTTYRNISCSSPYCSALDTSGCSGSTCLYAVQYGDNSYTVGFFAQDTLTLTSSDVVPNFRFGCGQKNNGLFGTAAGLVGLGRQSASLVSQTSSKYGGVFSYCLPASSSGTGYLTFGPVSAGNVQYTPMLTDSSQPSFYFLGLNDIGVGGQGLSLSPTLFSNAGVIIDSGTVITRLPPTAYTALRTAFRKQMASYPLSSPASILDTCYDFSTYQTVKIPTVAFAFKGATVNLDVSGIMYVASSTQACLAFAANGDDTDIVIIGNTQQKKFNVVYDVSKKQIGFGTGAC